MLRLWIAGVLAGAAGWAVLQLVSPVHHMARGIAALAVCTAVYGLITLAFGVPEAKAITRRILRR
jgi:hypothetical protein